MKFIKKQKARIFWFINIVVAFLVSFRLIRSKYDPDMWWHIKLGQQIVNLHTFANNFTYTCSNYVWINYSVLSDIIIYWIQNNFGFLALYLVFYIIFFAGILINYNTIVVLLRKRNIVLKSWFVFFLYISIIVTILSPFYSIRPQAFDFLFLSILLNFLFRIDGQLKKIHIVLSVPFFVLWLNLHGGFIVGIAVVGAFCFYHFALSIRNLLSRVEFSKTQKEFWLASKYLLIILLALIFSFINPFGFRVWEEIFTAISSSLNTTYIQEWKSIDFHEFYIKFYFGIFLFTILSYIFTKHKNWLLFLIFLPLSLLSFQSIRYILISGGIVSIIVFYQSIIYLHENIELTKSFYYKMLRRYAQALMLIFILVTGVLSGMIFVDMLKSSPITLESASESGYPFKASQLIKNNSYLMSINFYNDYSWGGYLDYAIPDKKWFIDGRMSAWSCKGQVKDYIIEEAAEINKLGPKWQDVIEKNDIKGILTQQGSALYNVMKTLPGWKLIYSDKESGIFVKWR